MYLSCLLIDIGDNPDRPRPGRTWLRNLYHVHQRLCMAFPSAPRKTADEDFLQPFRADDFAVGQVHVPREAEAGFLFRIDPQAGGRVAVLVQSATRPDWDYAFHNAAHFLAAPAQWKPFDPCFAAGEQLRFRLLANPTRRPSTERGQRDAERVPVPPDQFGDWLARHAERGGFALDKESLAIQPGYVYFSKGKHGPNGGNSRGQCLRSARYDGVLRITEPVKFGKTLAHGIGPAKAFGFGLLSLAPTNR
jgi:CRISPR system Cascade subunit CasE